MQVKQVQLAVIGAGPAGLTAAAQAAALGVETVVLDLYSRPGGQYYHLPPPEFDILNASGDAAQGMLLEKAALDAGAQIWNNTEVWGIYPEEGFLIGLSGAEKPRLRARKVIIATGAMERSLPFPGWTLPGVMTAGAALALLKHQRIVPGRRFLFSGSGPLQLAAAAYLAEAGAEVKAVLEQHQARSLLPYWRLGADWRRLREGWSYLSTLRRQGARVRAGWGVVRAAGQGQVERSIIARLDRSGRPIAGSQQSIEVDAICQGYGLAPASRLSRVLGCQHIFHPVLHTYTPVRDDDLQTSVAGCFVAGDAAEIIGKNGALLEGRLASLAVARQLGEIDQRQVHEKTVELRAALRRERAYASLLNRAFAPQPGLWSLMEDDTIICRCEQVTLAQVRQAVQDGMHSFAGVKNHSRAGMGWCQGRMCWMNAAHVIADQLGIGLENASRHTLRPPIFPVTLGDMLEDEPLLEVDA